MTRQVSSHNQQFMTSRPSTAAPILAVLAIVLATLGPYVGGYFWLCKYRKGTAFSIRIYSNRWQALMFTPAATVENLASGREPVILDWPEP